MARILQKLKKLVQGKGLLEGRENFILKKGLDNVNAIKSEVFMTLHVLYLYSIIRFTRIPMNL